MVIKKEKENGGRILGSCSGLWERAPERERRAPGERVPGAPRLLGYPLGFPLPFIRGRQGLELRPSSPGNRRASRAAGTRALEDACLITTTTTIIITHPSSYICIFLSDSENVLEISTNDPTTSESQNAKLAGRSPEWALT